MIFPNKPGLILRSLAASDDETKDSSTDRAMAIPKGGSAGAIWTFTPTFESFVTDTTLPMHPRYFPFVNRTLASFGNRSATVSGPRSVKRGSGAGECTKISCKGTSASSFPKIFLVAPVDGFVRIPWRGTTLSRQRTFPISIPPEPGTPYPFRYFSLIVVDSSSHV